MIPFVFFGSCIGSVLTAALLHWMYQGAFAKWEGKALAKLARLRLTDEEREAIHFMFRHAAQAADHDPFPDSADYIPHHKVISAMMERLA